MTKRIEVDAEWLEEDPDDEEKFQFNEELMENCSIEELFNEVKRLGSWLLNRDLCKTCKEPNRPACCERCKANQERIKERWGI